nr:peptidase T [uncultured Blautia sp.]
MDIVERFLKYVQIDTQSEDDREEFPSTEKQRNLAVLLKKELIEMGASEVRLDEHCYVYAKIPANTDQNVPSVGFISHMDTAPACPGTGILPQIHRGYDGGALILNKEKNITMSPEQFPELMDYIGKDLITSDGTTLLGADDKAGVAEIMTMAEYLLTHPEVKHGDICIGFTPDEEVGRGADFFDLKGFGADVAYTVDGGALGEIEYENFNAASAKVKIHGVNIHPGSARGQMKNSLLIGMEFQQMLPVFENPACTDGYEGFFHLDSMSGNVEETVMDYIIRDHDKKKFQEKKDLVTAAAEYMNKKYGEGTVELILKDSYYNMKEKIEPHKYLIEVARKAMQDAGVEPVTLPIRGGTDGARLSYEGLPCPNLCTGGLNFHGRYEYICIQSMEKIAEILTDIVKRFATGEKQELL